jgi:hypothetical protein
LGQGRANRSKKAKVFFRQIDSVRANPVAAGLWRQSQDRNTSTPAFANKFVIDPHGQLPKAA